MPVSACRGVGVGVVVSSRVCVCVLVSVWVRGCPGVWVCWCLLLLFLFILICFSQYQQHAAQYNSQYNSHWSPHTMIRSLRSRIASFFKRFFLEYTSEMEESWSAAPAVPRSISSGAPRGFVPNTPMLRASVTVICCLGYSESSPKREDLERRPGSPRHRYRWTPRTILRVRELSVDQSALLSFLGDFLVQALIAAADVAVV